MPSEYVGFRMMRDSNKTRVCNGQGSVGGWCTQRTDIGLATLWSSGRRQKGTLKTEYVLLPEGLTVGSITEAELPQ